MKVIFNIESGPVSDEYKVTIKCSAIEFKTMTELLTAQATDNRKEELVMFEMERAKDTLEMLENRDSILKYC